MKLDFEYGQGLMSANLPDNTDIFVPGETVPDPECLPQDWDTLYGETLWCCDVKEFGPLIVSIDADGRNLFEENKVIFNQKKDAAVQEICKHVSFIK